MVGPQEPTDDSVEVFFLHVIVAGSSVLEGTFYSGSPKLVPQGVKCVGETYGFPY